ncbi:MAG TPA: sigma-70 family RNA polymerase sigma factor [Acidimicrobiales bacterium]|nr:sigma-70 family RNA polymerase sigma factor [Acidimicrobiales bacterium]
MPTERPNAAQVYRQLAPPVLGYLRSERVPDAEDVLGEVFLQVARDIGRFRGDDGALRRWVFSIAHNRAVDAHRRAARERGRLSELPAEAPAGAVEVPAELVDPTLVDALSALSAEQREVLVLRFVADLSLEAVARITGRRVGAVKALQHRGLESLRRALGGAAGEPPEPFGA